MPTTPQQILKVRDALFQKTYQKGKNSQHVFKDTIKKFDIGTPNSGSSFWAVMGPRKSDFLSIVAAKYIPAPPLSRQYPALTDFHKSSQIQLLNFRENSGLDEVHLSARYESYSYKGALEMSDDVNSVANYVKDANNYNSNISGETDAELTENLMRLFDLTPLKLKWINSLSNGQMRRARIAKALFSQPRLLVIDDPFLGLDPEATDAVAASLHKAALDMNTSVVVGLRLQDKIPEWITHLAFVDDSGLRFGGKKDEVFQSIKDTNSALLAAHERNETLHKKEIFEKTSEVDAVDPIIEFKSASVVYKGVPVLKEFSWKVNRGSRWRVLGVNGSGKTTILSLITADHPQSWRSVLSINGILRKSGSGVSYFEVNDKIGISSPELHALVPFNMTLKDLILNGLVPGVGNANFKYKFKGDEIPAQAQEILDHFSTELENWGTRTFSELTVSMQKLGLFLRAVLKKPDILILDEAFSCMDDEGLMLKCHEAIDTDLKEITLLCIGHLEWELPLFDYVLKLTGDENRTYELYKKSAK